MVVRQLAKKKMSLVRLVRNLRRCVSFPRVCLHQSVVIFWQMAGVLCWIWGKAIVFHRYSDSGEALIS